MTATGNPPNRALSRGFSLLEIVIAITVLAILTAAALPSMVELGRRMTISGHTNDLVGALTAAKSEAAKRGSVAGVGLVGGSNDWSSGWRVYVDSDNDGQLTGADTVIGSYGALADNYTVKTKVTNGVSDALVMFSAQGSLATPATQVDINVCRPDGQAAQSAWIHVGASGEIVSQRNTSSSNDLAPGC